MNQYLSTKFKVLSFFLITMIVYIHSYSVEIKFTSGTQKLETGYNLFIQELISNGFCRVALPIFFMISGYLLFLSIREFNFDLYHVKVKKRIKTLIIPFLFWSLYGILLYFFLQSVPFSSGFFTNQLVREYTIQDFFYKLFLEPIPYPIWFLRDLFILVLFSPVLYYLIKYVTIPILFLFLLTWILETDLIILKFKSLAFFSLGIWFAIFNPDYPARPQGDKAKLFTIIWVLLVTLKTTLFYFQVDLWIQLVFHKINVLCGVIALWCIYDYIVKNSDSSISNKNPLFTFTFFIFVFHEPVLTIVKKAFYFVIGYSQEKALFIYFIAPLLTITICIAVATTLKRLTPEFYNLITGKR